MKKTVFCSLLSVCWLKSLAKQHLDGWMDELYNVHREWVTWLAGSSFLPDIRHWRIDIALKKKGKNSCIFALKLNSFSPGKRIIIGSNKFLPASSVLSIMMMGSIIDRNSCPCCCDWKREKFRKCFYRIKFYRISRSNLAAGHDSSRQLWKFFLLSSSNQYDHLITSHIFFYTFIKGFTVKQVWVEKTSIFHPSQKRLSILTTAFTYVPIPYTRRTTTAYTPIWRTLH